METRVHNGNQVLYRGAVPASSSGAVIALHGRGGSADDILELGAAIAPRNWSIIAPQAERHTWYPESFLAPRSENEPYLSAAMRLIASIVESLSHSGLQTERIVICGFSQGACLASEYVGRHPTRYAGLVCFTGGLIGAPSELSLLDGDLEGTPVLLSSGDPDPHVPWSRVMQTAELLTQINGKVTVRRYPGRAHTVSSEEIMEARELLAVVQDREQ